jgi:hypothetical protein
LGFNNIVAINAAVTPLLYVLPLSAMAVSLFIMVRGNRQQVGGGRIEKFFDAIAEVAASIANRIPRGTRPAGGVG